MVFHHSNGSCYVVDCGSAHGTYVNGTRIPSPSNGGLVIPFKVKRGALVRFGGPGAPCFLLKSFPHVVPDDAAAVAATSDSASPVDASSSPDMGELVRRNTRLNAMGIYGSSDSSSNVTTRDSICSTIEKALMVSCKRSFDSLSDETLPALTASSMDEEDSLADHPPNKRPRCSSPPLVDQSPIRLVSPELPNSAARPRVTFSTEPPQLHYPVAITPEEPCDEGDCRHD